MVRDLPDVLDCRLAPGTRRDVQGTLAASRAERLGRSYGICEPIVVALNLAAEGAGRTRLTGTATATLEGRCQRCLEPLRFVVAATIDVVALADEALRRQDDEEWVLMEDGRLDAVALVEDELFLACPMIEAHARAECPAEVSAASDTERRKPFADLDRLLRRPP